MSNISLSVIIPCRNSMRHIGHIIEEIAAEVKETETEFIVIDMNSTDESVITALETIKANNLRGCVIQSGGSGISSALNTGIYKSDGKYVTFIYPGRRYKNYLETFLDAASEKAADFIFSFSNQSGVGKSNAESIKKSGNDRLNPTDLMTDMIYSAVSFDFTAVMLKREFLLLHHIRFYEDCSYGYLEAFIYNALLHHPQLAAVSVTMERAADRNTAANKEGVTENINCYERIESMLKVYESMKLQRRENLKLVEMFECQKLPSVLLSVADILKKQGFSTVAIKKSMKQKGYSQYLKVSGCTTPELKKRILQFRFAPWLYQ